MTQVEREATQRLNRATKVLHRVQQELGHLIYIAEAPSTPSRRELRRAAVAWCAAQDFFDRPADERDAG